MPGVARTHREYPVKEPAAAVDAGTVLLVLLIVVATSGFSASGFAAVSGSVECTGVSVAWVNHAGSGEGGGWRVPGTGVQPVARGRSGGASTVVGQRGGRLETSPVRGHGVAVLGGETTGRDDLLRINGKRVNGNRS